MTTTTKPRAPKRPRPSEDFYVAFPKAVSSLKKFQETFVSAVGDCRQLIDVQIEENVLKIQHQIQQLEDLDVQYEKKQRQHDEDYERKCTSMRIDLEQALRTFGYVKACEIIKEHGEVTIDKEKLVLMQRDLLMAKADHKQEVDTAVGREREIAKQQLSQYEQTTKLQQEAAVAKVQARLEQKDDQIKVLNQTIQSLKEEVVAARELVGRVADSQRAPEVHHHAK
jgi:hypothetical protein